MQNRYLITGRAGFIGSNFIRYLLEVDSDVRVTNLDLLTYAGVDATLHEFEREPRYTFVKGDIRDQAAVDDVVRDHDVIVNFAAETHVDRSISGPTPFLDTNVVGTGELLQAAYRHDVPTFLQVSTDEVYGSIPEGSATEDSPLVPSSPYAASKAAADLLAGAFNTTFGYPALITRSTNNFGPYQFPEKVIPLFITNLLDHQPVPVYGDGLNERDWLHVEDHCRALHRVLHRGTPGEIYNIGAGAHMSNLELPRRILRVMNLDESLIDFVPDRPGHDFRYSLDASKIQALGWTPQHSLEERLEETVDWYRGNAEWWKPLRAGPA